MQISLWTRSAQCVSPPSEQKSKCDDYRTVRVGGCMREHQVVGRTSLKLSHNYHTWCFTLLAKVLRF